MLRSGLHGLRLASVALAAALVATPASWSMPPTVLGPSPMLPGLSPGGLRLEHLTPAVLGLSVGQATAGVLPAAPQPAAFKANVDSPDNCCTQSRRSSLTVCSGYA